jgi:hypothetical protein
LCQAPSRGQRHLGAGICSHASRHPVSVRVDERFHIFDDQLCSLGGALQLSRDLLDDLLIDLNLQL